MHRKVCGQAYAVRRTAGARRSTSTLYGCMRVLDFEQQWWFLLEDAGELFVDANCNHSFLGYEFMVRLTPEERTQFEAEGREVIERLVRSIQDTVPILEGSTSPFVGRDVSRQYSEAVTAAVAEWKRQRGGHAA